MTSGGKESQEIQRVGGRLHRISEVIDDDGTVISRVAAPLRVEFKLEDVAQLLTGALMLAVPVALTEEVWVLGEELPVFRIYLIAGLSLAVNAFFVKMLFYPGELWAFRVEFFKRVFVGYAIAVAAALIMLSLIGKGLLVDPYLAMRQAVIIALPASFAATAMDYIR
jgi:uncharacterized membrane protein